MRCGVGAEVASESVCECCDRLRVLICVLPWWRAACVVLYHRSTYELSASCGPSC